MSDQTTAPVLPEAPVEPPIGISNEPPDPTKVDDMFGAAFDDAFKKDMAAKEPEPMPEAPPQTPADADKPKLDLTKKEDAKPVETPTPTDEWRDTERVPRKSEEWNTYREKHNATVAELKKIQAEAAELRAKTAELDRMQELQKQVAEYEQQIKEAQVLNDPALTKDIDRRLKVVQESVAASLDDAKAKDFSQIMSLPTGKHRDKMVAEFMEEVPAWQQAKLGAMLARSDELRAERDAVIGEARANVDSILKQKQEALSRQQESMKARQASEFESVANEFRKMPGWQSIFEDEKVYKPWLDNARNVYNGNVGSPKDLARKAIMAETAPALLEHAIEVSQQLVEREKRIAALEGELKKYKSSTPTPNTITGAEPGSGDMDFVEGAMRAFQTGVYQR